MINKFLLAVGVVLATATVTKKVLNMSTEKQIYSGLIAAGMSSPLALCVLAQSKVETSVHGIPFMNRQFIMNNNPWGYSYVKGNSLQVVGGGGKHPEDAGVYAKYDSLDNAIKDIVGYYKRHIAHYSNVSDLQGYVAGIISSKYQTGNPDNYLKGLKKYYKSENEILNV